MIWRFSIIDRNNVTHYIDECVGWDSNVSEIKRDLDWHGIVFTNQGETFQFDGNAMKLLKEEYDAYGVEGDMTLVMEEDCGNGYEEFSRGKFMFKDFEFVCGDDCYVKVPVETTKETKDLRNRLNQKVNLETTVAFDETTALPAYTALPFEMELPSKGIFIKDHSINETNIDEEFNGGLQAPFNTGWNLTYGQLEFAMTIKAAEIGGFSFNPVQKVGTTYHGHTMDLASQNSNTANLFPDTSTQNTGHPFPMSELWPLNLSPVVNYYADSPNYGQISNPVQLGLLFNGRIDVLNTVVSTTAFYLLRLPNRPNLLTNGELLSHYEIVYRNVLYDPSNYFPNPGTGGIGLQPGSVLNIGATFVNNNFILNQGDRLYMFITITERKNQSMINAINNGAKAFKLTINQNSFFKISNLSHTPATTSKVFAVNEALSRISESITNDKLRAYSEYFGRTDSQPYSHAVDGCGGLEVITDGIRIRKQENRIPNKPSLFSLSLQDIFEGLNPIHNIGMGVETDPNRAGYNRLRVEPWQHFYNNTIILSCTDVGKVTRKMYEKEVFSTFQFGYAKWEAEEYTGLDEFLTKRTYRTTLNQVKNDLVKLSKFIASGYALEITRRKGDNNSKDWRYDKESFIICATRVPHFKVIFNAANNTIKVFTNQQNQPYFLGPATIAVAGTVNNNAIYNIISATTTSFDYVLYQVTQNIVFDEECFITTFPSIVFPSGLYVELGNVLNPQNIIDPATLYNYRISPIRNAMRWMNRVFESYKQLPSAKIIFTDGDANYYAQGEMQDPNCKLENSSLTENETIDLTIYADPNNAKPFLSPERVVFDYPMSSKEYKTIEANPYGLIHFSSDSEDGFGWIESTQYKPEEGKGTFTLIPKAI
jgi:hypothetical protein